MSKDKGKADQRREELLAYIKERGKYSYYGVVVNYKSRDGLSLDNKDLQWLIKNKKVYIYRPTVFSSFGDHIKRTFVKAIKNETD